MQTSILVLSQTAKSGGIFWPLAKVMGLIMNGIYFFLDHCLNIQNVAFTVILFTIIMYAVMFPLANQQQKYTIISSIMNPEVQYIQNKYKGVTDPAALKKMQAEVKNVYKKYGVHPSGSCLMMLLEFVILFPLYSVITNVPNYISGVKAMFADPVSGIMAVDGYKSIIKEFVKTAAKSNNSISGVIQNFSTPADAANTITGLLYRCTSDNWETLKNTFPDLSSAFSAAQHTAADATNLFGVSIVYSPKKLLSLGAGSGTTFMIIIAILIPVLSAGLQILNMYLGADRKQKVAENPLANQMRGVTYGMMIYSFILVFCLPVGVGIYWIAGSAIRCLEQLYFNAMKPKIAARSQAIADASWKAIRAEEALITEDYAQGKKEETTDNDTGEGNSFCECDLSDQANKPTESVDYTEVSENDSDQENGNVEADDNNGGSTTEQ